MKRQDTTNTFNEGLIMDLNPLVTPNNVVTNCLNGTLVTYNGNENVLQNDMGNGRVETAFLPEGYVPLGTAELGGIIYIVSYNPLIDKCQIGCFPSPERNITSDELQTPSIGVNNTQFLSDEGRILNTILKVKLLSDPNSIDGIFKLNPGDKYTIYSTNKGISLNKGYISDIGRSEHKFGIDPQTVTIHVVSIGEDGKIVYLDNFLKWSGSDGNPAHYYIKECKQGDDIKTDIDEYRSLVSSAYNIFNSKVSGELALLFELEVIDTFSVTWDANVEDIEGADDKKATIDFNLNYTSGHSNVNLEYAIISISDFPSKLMLTTPTILKGLHCSLHGKNSGRENDGTDSDIKVEVGKFNYSSKGNLQDYIWNYQVTPAMKFGYLDYLAVNGSINFLEIGSGKTELDEWRYFIQDKNFYLNWGLSAYPEKNKMVDNVTMTFIPFDEVGQTTVFDDKEDHSDVYKKYSQYIISDKSSYSGYFQELINFDEVGSKVKNQKLKQNFLYLVDICIKYGSNKKWEYRHNYKWLYTTKQWNEVFVHDLNLLDFSELTLDNVLKFGFDCLVKDNIGTLTNVYNSNVTFPRTLDADTLEYIIDGKGYKQPYAVAGALITTVNYTPSSGFNSTNASIEAEAVAKCISYPELFSFEKTSADRYQFALALTYITHDDFVPKSDTKQSVYASLVTPKVKEYGESNKLESIASDLSLTIKSIIDEGIKTEDIDNKAIDSFSSSLSNKGNNFSVNVRGAIFSRINADLDVKPVTVGLEIRPFLYLKDDYELMGLVSSSEFLEYFEEWHEDHGGGDPFYFTFKSKTLGEHTSKKKNWNPSDDWSRSNWWDDIPPYNNYLNPWMLSMGGCFLVMMLHGGKGTLLNGGNVLGKHILWARTTEGHYVPISNTGTQASLANKVATLYAQLYYVNTDTVSMNLPIVTNINYMTNYSEVWNMEIESSLSLVDIENNVKLMSNLKNLSLLQLLGLCNGLPIDIRNIQKSKLAKIKFDNQVVSHTFYMLNIVLYDKYDNNKSTTIPAIALLSTSDTWERCLPKTQNNIYVRNTSNKDSVDFTKLNQTSAKNLFSGGSLELKPVGDLLRLIYKEGSKIHSPGAIYGCFLLVDGGIQLLQSKLLGKKVNMSFLTNAKGDPWSTVYNNSGYNLT